MGFKANLGTIAVTVGADTESFQKGMEVVGKGIKDSGKALRKNVNTWGNWAAGISAAALAATGAIVKSNLGLIRELKNLAAASNENVKAFQQGAFVVEQYGISTEKYGDILKDVNDRVGDFVTTGGGAMIDFFEQVAPKVGITADAFRGLSGQQSLGLYIDSLEKANLSQEEMTFFMEAIASDSTRLLPLFKNNAAAMKQLTKEADDLGIGLSTLDVASVELANRELSKIGGFMESIGQELTVQLAPAITGIATEFTDAAKESGGFGAVIEDVIGFGVSTIGVFANAVRGIKVVFKGVEVIARKVIMEISKDFDVILNPSINKTGRFIVDLIVRPFRAALEIASKFSDGAKEALKSLDGTIDGIFGQADQSLGDFAQAQKEAFEKSKDELKTLALEKIPSVKIAEFVDDAQRKFKDEISKREAIDLTGGSVSTDKKPTQTQAEKDEAERIRKESEGILEALRERFALQNETQLGQFERERAILDDHLNRKLITEQEFSNLSKQIAEDEARVKNQILTSAIGAGIQALSVGGKKTEKLQKRLAIAQALIKGKQAAVDAWQAGMSVGGPWAPLVAASYAAASIAKTGSLINSIRSGGRGSAGGGGVPQGASGGATATGGGGQSNAPQRNLSRTIDIRGLGSGNRLFSTDQVRELMGMINEQIGDGVELNAT